ncbi:c-type cytochrome [Xylophilus sp.]|uniref:c-type cytochrome n=1 Tax=Xylophilus sp. TaxID=2653893 RepID=UPI0013BD6B72|nr:cytochrome c [Xylophilus sp.]KAF1046007.1 MAG: Gluconate 2-dehydrogenase cytochrome c subunit [Xylophilus sp.]
MKRSSSLAFGVAAAIGLAAFGAALMPPAVQARDGAVPAAAPDAPDAQVIRGEYLARAGDCISCHTRAQGAPFAGGLPMATPFGTIVSTNITPDRQHGIGEYTQEDFARALRKGRARDGHYLYPAMPYANFARLSDDDLAALYAYFMKGVKPAAQDNPRTDLKWPYRMRWLMAGWNLLYLPGRPYQPDTKQTAEWNRGAYLVQGLGHCSACHTPRGFAGAEKASTERDGGLFLSGAVIDGWYAQPLRNTAAPGLAGWSTQELVEYLKTGRTAHTAAFGPLAQVVTNSTQHLSRDDLGAVAAYLKSLGSDGSGPAGAALQPPAPAPQSKPSQPPTDPTALARRSGRTDRPGALVYVNNCAACHRSDGQGASRTFPTLARNSAVAAQDPTSLIRIVLQGSSMPYTAQAPSELGMPGFGWRLTDRNVADLLTFVRSSWGNRAGAVTPGQVAQVRSTLGQSASTDAAALQQRR